MSSLSLGRRTLFLHRLFRSPSSQRKAFSASQTGSLPQLEESEYTLGSDNELLQPATATNRRSSSSRSISLSARSVSSSARSVSSSARSVSSSARLSGRRISQRWISSTWISSSRLSSAWISTSAGLSTSARLSSSSLCSSVRSATATATESEQQ